MQLKKLIQFKKNSKFIRINKLYFDLLKTKHLLSFFVGSLKKKQFLNCYKVISRRKLYTSFLMKLEFRLEVILLKLGLVITGKQAKQLILHGQVCINGLIITAYNYQLKLKDFVSIDRSFILIYKEMLICNLFKTFGFFNFLKKKRVVKKLTLQSFFIYLKFPSFLEINYRTYSFYVVKTPSLQDITSFSRVLSIYNCNQLYFIL